MVRVLVFWSLIFGPSPVWASTILAPDAFKGYVDLLEMQSFLEILSAYIDSYRDGPGTASSPYVLMAIYVVGITTYAVGISTLLPRRKRYPLWAARAMSRIRWTMARSPFERWDDR